MMVIVIMTDDFDDLQNVDANDVMLLAMMVVVMAMMMMMILLINMNNDEVIYPSIQQLN
jgi:hypothetical protein